MCLVSDLETLEKIKANGASLVLFGGEHCSVCQSIRPQLERLLQQHFSRMQFVYIDCEQSPAICAQYGIFSLPAVRVYIDGMAVLEDARAFSLKDLQNRIERPYELWCGSDDSHT